MKIAVIGMGKIGLPLAVQYAQKGHDVIGVDINNKTIDLINKGLEPFPEEEHLQEYLHEVIRSKNLRATASYEEAVSDADVIVVIVPLFVNENSEPDFTAMDSATRNIGKNLKKNSLVCYETTLPIGTTRKRFTPALEQESGFKAGEDFAVVFSPERVFTGRIFQDLKKYPKIVGGLTETCAQRGEAFYQQVLDFDVRKDLSRPNGVWRVNSVESAELVKLAETSYRDVNIAFANEISKIAKKYSIQTNEVIIAANSQSYSHIHQPGISVGGHCIPVYPRFLTWQNPELQLIKTSREVNDGMPAFYLNLFDKHINLHKKKVLIYGVTYRPRVREVHNSGAFMLRKLLLERECTVYAIDPLFSELEIIEMGFEIPPQNLDEIEVVIIHTPHEGFSRLKFNNENVKIFDVFTK